MKGMNLHEDSVRHIDRLLRGHLYNGSMVHRFDDMGRLHVDDWELRQDVQTDVQQRWARVSTDNIMDVSDLSGFRRDFLRIFGFEADGVDYDADVSPLG
jgi:enoyl-[acyl-carrier protein] reductase / trans-2-enoyl-CoA reductase (NAD+)